MAKERVHFNRRRLVGTLPLGSLWWTGTITSHAELIETKILRLFFAK
ncbi:MAG: hypothetical protein ABIN97_21235 [Ginsengibacter sp.]